MKAIRPRRDPFKRAASGQAIAAASAEIDRFLYVGQALLQTYPPKRGGGYRRTGNLGRRWNVRRTRRIGRDLIGRLGNNAAYAIWVQGPTKGAGKRQRKAFKRLGWTSVTDVMRQWPTWRRAAIKALRRTR